MREQYTGPGKYEGCTAFHAFIADHIDSLAIESSGDVESPTGWFAYVAAGRRSFIVTTDDRGFHYVTEYDSEALGLSMFDTLEEEYSAWSDEDEDEDEDPEPTPEPDLLICTDCLMWHANGDTSGIDDPEREREVRRADALDRADRPYVVIDSGESPDPGFMWRPCDTCGSRLAGDRHAAWIVRPA